MTEIKKLAGQIRNAMEVVARKEQFNPDLCGLCAKASIQLFLEARRRGMHIGLIAGQGHVYNVYKGHIVDVTGTQFGHPDRVVCEPLENKSRLSSAYQTNYGRIRSVKDLTSKAWLVSWDDIHRDRLAVRQELGE